jgi:hypothetical protein
MKVRLGLAALAAAVGTMLVVTPGALAQPVTNQSVAIPVTASPATVNGALGTLTGTLNITNVQLVNGVATVVGTFTGNVTNAAGTVLATLTNVPVQLPILATSAGTCQILHLELGPLDLNVLGLVVHLDKVVLDITAQSGPGNLLGNLLCAVAHLLDNTGSNGLVTVLNNLLRL